MGRGGRRPHPHRLQALRQQGGKRKCRDMTTAAAAAAAVTDTRAGWGRRGDSRGGGGGQGATPNPLSTPGHKGQRARAGRAGEHRWRRRVHGQTLAQSYLKTKITETMQRERARGGREKKRDGEGAAQVPVGRLQCRGRRPMLPNPGSVVVRDRKQMATLIRAREAEPSSRGSGWPKTHPGTLWPCSLPS